MKYDLIIVSKSSEQLKKVTQKCIDTARQDDCDLNVIIVETGERTEYDGANEIIMYRGEFNYNRALNTGLQKVKGDIHILANNDLLFHRGWSKIGKAMIDNNFPSASALSQDPRQKGYQRGDWIYEGYVVGRELTGWCIFVTKNCIKQIGKLDESVHFWYSDNIYADQLMCAGIRHGLFCNVQIDHITSATLRTVSGKEQRNLSFGEMGRYKISRIKYAT